MRNKTKRRPGVCSAWPPLLNLTPYRFRPVSLKEESPDGVTSLFGGPLLERTSRTILPVESEISAAFTSERASPVLQISWAPSSLKMCFARLVSSLLSEWERHTRFRTSSWPWIPARTTYRIILIAVFVAVTIVVAVSPVAMVTVMFTVFVPFSFAGAIPLTIVPLITVMLVPFAVVSTRYGYGELLRERAGDREGS